MDVIVCKTFMVIQNGTTLTAQIFDLFETAFPLGCHTPEQRNVSKSLTVCAD